MRVLHAREKDSLRRICHKLRKGDVRKFVSELTTKMWTIKVASGAAPDQVSFATLVPNSLMGVVGRRKLGCHFPICVQELYDRRSVGIHAEADSIVAVFIH